MVGVGSVEVWVRGQLGSVGYWVCCKLRSFGVHAGTAGPASPDQERNIYNSHLLSAASQEAAARGE